MSEMASSAAAMDVDAIGALLGRNVLSGTAMVIRTIRLVEKS